MKTAAQKKLFQTFETSSKDNGIVMFKEKLQQARRSGSSYRCQKEAKERVELSYRFSDDLMRPYQDTYRNQIPAILLAMCDKGALTHLTQCHARGRQKRRRPIARAHIQPRGTSAI